MNETPSSVVAQLHLGRYAGLAVEAVPGSAENTRTILDAVLELDSELKLLSEGLVAALYRAVPAVVAKQPRREVLRAKRRVFAGLETGLRTEVFAVVSAEPDVLRQLCLQWDESVRSRKQLLHDLSDAVTVQESEIMSALKRTLNSEAYMTSLSVSAPGFVNHLLSGRMDLDSARVARTLYLYGTRTSRKTSPFSGLTTIAEPGKPALGRRHAVIARHLSWATLYYAVQRSSSLGNFPVTVAPNKQIDVSGFRELAIISRHHLSGEAIYREDSVVGAENVKKWSDIVDSSTSALPSVVAQKFQCADPSGRFDRLLSCGILKPAIPWSRSEEPFDTLRTLWPEKIGAVTDLQVAEVAQIVRGFTAMAARERLKGIEKLNELAACVLPKAQGAKQTRGFLYEDRECDFSEDSPLSDDSVQQDLRQLSDMTEPWVFRSHIYDLMVARFVAMYGAGGQCKEPLAFFMTLAVEGDGDHEVMLTARMDFTADYELRKYRTGSGGQSAVARHLCAYTQFAAPSRDALRNGGGLTVVNGFGSGNGALQARFHELLGSDFRTRLRGHISKLWQPELVLEFHPWSDCNTGQATCAGVLPQLGLPGEPGTTNGVPLDSLRLEHDPQTETLFLTLNGNAVGVAYLGLTPQHLLQSYHKWLALLSDPWVRIPPFSDYSQRIHRARSEPGVALAHWPRMQHGRLVTGRASWELSAALVGSLMSTDDNAMLLNWRAISLEHGIPHEVFVYQRRGASGSAMGGKPLFVDLASPLSLRVLAGWFESRSTHLYVVEALPDRFDHHVRNSADQPIAAEYLVNFGWPE